MAANNLEFLDTMSVGQFKVSVHAEKVEVFRNPETGKLFFAAGNVTGAVAKEGVPAEPVISRVKGDNGAEFYLLHKKGEGLEAVAVL